MNNNCSGVGYVIREGDTLYKISKRFRIPLPILLRANLGVNVYNLIPGQKICIPLWGMEDDEMDYMPPECKVPPNDLLPTDEMMPLPERPPMGEIRPKHQFEDNMLFTNEINSTRKHIVGDNESLESIMDMYNVSIEELFKCNNRNGIILKEDQIINMP